MMNFKAHLALGLISCSNCMLRWASHEIPILVFVNFECFLSLLGQPQNLKIYNVYSSCCCNNTYVMFTSLHSSEKSGLCSTKCSSETLQNLLYFMYKKTHVVFFVFHFMQFYFFPYECPGL